MPTVFWYGMWRFAHTSATLHCYSICVCLMSHVSILVCMRACPCVPVFLHLRERERESEGACHCGAMKILIYWGVVCFRRRQ